MSQINFAATYQIKNEQLFRQAAYLAGEWVEAETVIDVVDPATGAQIGTVPSLSKADVEKAVEKAHMAQAKWANLLAKERSQILRKWFDLIIENKEDLAKIMVAENGKPISEALGEVAYAANFVEWYAEEAKRIYGDHIPAHMKDTELHAIYQAVGVCSAITPWNFPLAMITRKAAPALAAGCSIVIKPAELTPFSAMALAELADQAGVPAGVLSIVTGNSKEIGPVLTTHPLIKKLSFTGSTAVGKILLEQASSTVKRTSMELGGNAPFIVFNDADMEDAVTGAVSCKFRNNGQTCVCANRLYVQEDIFDDFLNSFIEKVKALTVGNGFENKVDLGPLIEEKALKKVQDLVEDAVQKGAKLHLGGKPHQKGDLFYQPTILTGVTEEMKIASEEIFGPVAVLYKFSTEEQVIALANNTNYGLAGYFYSQNLGRVHRVSRALEYGIVGVNTGIISTESAPFGGVKESGTGREGGKYGIEEYLSVKYICQSGLGGK